ncbi:MAG: MFS transporter, partial [Verrucomicrobiae bacterium]|nr:MFS transporter [Verrucomicrobiae bacterium]
MAWMARPHPMAQAWLVVGLLWFVACLNYLDRVMITTMRGSLVEAIPMTEAQFGLLTAVFLWVYGLLSPFAGFLADRFSRSRAIIVSLLVWSALTWLTGHARTFEQLLVARALMGISEAIYIPAALALIADYHRGNTRSLATGVHMTGVSVGAGLGGLGGWLAETRGWSYAFYLFGIIGIAYAVLLLFLLRDATRDSAGAPVSAGADQRVNFFRALASLFGHGTFYLMLAYWG